VKKAVIILVLVLLLLDYAALDDITTGNEPNYFGEYIFLLWSLAVFALLIQYKGNLKAIYTDIKNAINKNRDLKYYLTFRAGILLLLTVFMTLGLVFITLTQILKVL
jgi:hypothetical protein